MTKNERANLIEALHVALALYVDTTEDRERFAALVADRMALPFPQHFVEACTSGDSK